VGLLIAATRITSARSVLAPLEQATAPWFHDAMVELEREATSRLGDAGAGLASEWYLGLRYVGQSHEVPIAFVPDVTTLLERFEHAHEQLYGTRLGDPIEIVNCWATVVEPAGMPEDIWAPPATCAGAASSRRRLALFGDDVKVVPRHAIAASLTGPCLVEEPRSVTLVPPGATANIQRGHLVLELR
jgi:N-methylhydantoinase A